MARLATVVIILAVIACVITAPATGSRKKTKLKYLVTASDGSIGVGHVSGGTFGDGSFSIGHGGMSTGNGHGGHGGNHGTNSYGGPGGDSGHTSYS